MTQTLNRFYNVISERVEIPSESLVEVTQFLLACVIRRLHYTGAATFIAQLPKGLQEDLWELPAGPDRKVTRAFIIGELNRRFGILDERSGTILSGFIPALKELVSQKEIESLEGLL